MARPLTEETTFPNRGCREKFHKWLASSPLDVATKRNRGMIDQSSSFISDVWVPYGSKNVELDRIDVAMSDTVMIDLASADASQVEVVGADDAAAARVLQALNTGLNTEILLPVDPTDVIGVENQGDIIKIQPF